MGRWQPDAAGRLSAAALELYTEQGFEQTTVAEIAARAGLTERTFFRYYADKREVIFGGQDELLATFIAGLRATPHDTAPLDAVAAGILASGPFFSDRSWSRRRGAAIAANPGLMEREVYKMTTISAALRVELVARGVDPLAAGLAADAGVTAFKFAFERWIADGETREMEELIRVTLAELRELTAAG
jgi:AcrR family transcriptional regulator